MKANLTLPSLRRALPGALLLCLSLLLPLACKKAPPPEPEAVPLPAELKSYTLFQPGTYWIYQDSTSRQVDSVWVVSAEVSVVRLIPRTEKYPTDKYETFRLQTRSKQGAPDQVFSVKRNCSLPGREDGDDKYPCWDVKRGQYLPNSTQDEGSTDVFPYTIPRDRAGFLNVNNAIMYPYWHSRPLLIGGKAYENVMEVKLTRDASEGGWPSHYYWAPGLGIVRQRVKVDGIAYTRTLLRSRIVQ